MVKKHEIFADTQNDASPKTSEKMNVSKLSSNPRHYDRYTHDPSTGESLYANFSPGFLNNSYSNASLGSVEISDPSLASATTPYRGIQFPLQEKQYHNMPN